MRTCGSPRAPRRGASRRAFGQGAPVWMGACSGRKSRPPPAGGPPHRTRGSACRRGGWGLLPFTGHGTGRLVLLRNRRARPSGGRTAAAPTSGRAAGGVDEGGEAVADVLELGDLHP